MFNFLFIFQLNLLLKLCLFQDRSILSNVSQPSWVDAATEVLDDDKIRLIERLRKEMTTAASRLEFERAAKIRDRIIQLENEFIN